jgi:hypothetical protein
MRAERDRPLPLKSNLSGAPPSVNYSDVRRNGDIHLNPSARFPKKIETPKPIRKPTHPRKGWISVLHLLCLPLL